MEENNSVTRCLLFQWGIDLRHQILTSKVDPRAEKCELVAKPQRVHDGLVRMGIP